MIVDVVIEKRFYVCSKGKVWTENAFPYVFWTRYLNQFDTVNIVARVHHVDKPNRLWSEVLGDKVTLTALPGYIGLGQFIRAIPATIKVLKQRRGLANRVIFRVPGVLSWLYQKFAMARNMPFGVEVVGDPSDTFASGASANPIRPIIRAVFIAMLKNQCRRAKSAGYVTEMALQRRYPPNPQGFSTHYSSILMVDEDYREFQSHNRQHEQSILCIGNLSQPYKGCDTMLEALSILKKKGVLLNLTWIGGGQLQPQMESLAKQLGVDQQVTFTGNIAERAEIRQHIDNADFFVLASRQEGLPRVVIESMARAKVCVATNVGGVNELLAPQWIVERDQPNALAETIVRAVNLTPENYAREAETNYAIAKNYHNDVLTTRREQMYQFLKEAI